MDRGPVTPEEVIPKNDMGQGSTIELSKLHPYLEASITLKKEVSVITKGQEIQGISIDLDCDSPKFKRIIDEVRELKKISEKDRPRRLLNIFNRYMKVAYDDEVNELGRTNPDLADWVNKNSGWNYDDTSKFKLSELIEAGMGVCQQLSIAYLAFASEAGMEGSLCTLGYSQDVRYNARNVIRLDTLKPLFPRAVLLDTIYGHMWVEIKSSENEWIPVDPFCNIVGDNEKSLQTLRNANYRATIGQSLELNLPPELNHLGMEDLMFLAGESTHKGSVKIKRYDTSKDYIGPSISNIETIAPAIGVAVKVQELETKVGA